MEILNKEAYTPMIQQYLDIKKDYTDAIVFFRLGDFYEMFFDDAILASRVLEIALTGKDAGVKERVPMCGVPFHAYASYAEKLLEAGYKVVIVEQVEDPSLAKGIVKRDVVKILTPGTIVDSFLNAKTNNYLASLVTLRKTFLLSYADISTGDGYVTITNSFDKVIQDLKNLAVKEIVLTPDFPDTLINSLKDNSFLISFEENTKIPDYLTSITDNIDKNYHKPIGLLLNYAIRTQKTELHHFKPFEFYTDKDYLRLDYFTKRNLELTETLRFNQKNGSLLSFIDHTSTAMGSRMLRKWLDRPLVDLNKIKERQNYIGGFASDYLKREDIKNCLKEVYDLERIIGRISCGNANAKDLVQLRHTLGNIPNIKSILLSFNNQLFTSLANGIDTHDNIYKLLSESLEDNPPFVLKEGGMIKYGYNKELDELKDLSSNSKKWLLDYETKEKERLGVKNLKVGYNKVFGYYIEISKGQSFNLGDIEGYVRRQTLANAERYISPELKKYEDILLGAKDKIEALEYELFMQIRDYVFKFIPSLQALANIISEIDCYVSLANVALENKFTMPTFNDEEIKIIDGRHPVLESILKEKYVANDVYINEYNMILITGPNMSGKSTYMRMFATIIILAQMGSFVPARICELKLFDQIFTRIGASDDLSSGQSTFMVEMSEANYAISNATKNSLILFDEIGRGTATYDGMAIAEAILEYVHQKVGAITLFSTHYHELTALEGKLKRLKNVHVEAIENNDGVAFLHKVKDGPTDKSYGINVASLAGMPKSLIARSKEILENLEKNNNQEKVMPNLFDFDLYEENEKKKNVSEPEAIKILRELDVDELSPKEALTLLYELKEKC